MKAISDGSTKLFGALGLLAAATLSGCAATGGSVTAAAATSRAAAPVASFAAPPGYVVCSGGHASRFDEREEQGRVCRPALSLHEIY